MNKKPLHVIYVPGLGDEPANGQRRAVERWKKYGVHGHFFQMHWADGERWQPKFERLLAFIDKLLEQGDDVAITGSSAGATAVIAAFAARRDQLVGAVIMAGKVNRPQYINPRLLQKNPAFGDAAHAAFTALDDLEDHHRVRLLSRYGFDPVVTKADSYIPGAKNRRIPTPGHVLTIAMQVTLGAPSFIRFLKRLQTAQN
jgi:pimeloyl-ACP methyl ester carboxylesterase